MTTSTGLSDQQNTYLRVLAILHYVHAAVIALGAGVMLVILVAGGFGMLWHRGMNGMDGMGAMRGMGPLTCLVPLLVLLLGYALLNLLVGRWLQQRRRWTAIHVVSAINVLNVPVGTLLGVFTIVVLLADDVRLAFEREAPPAPTPQPPSAPVT